MKILVAMLVYDGKIPHQTALNLFDERLIAFGAGDEMNHVVLPSCSHPAMGRNEIARSFMESDFDKLFFLDSDITFLPGSIVKLCHKPVDYVGGAYRFKHEPEQYPVGWLDKKELRWDENELLEVAHVPAGFTALSRNVFDSIRHARPERHYEHLGHKHYCYFETSFVNGGLHSEESFFCNEWRATGGKVFLDPEIELTHWDFNPKPFKGHIGNWLKSRGG